LLGENQRNIVVMINTSGRRSSRILIHINQMEEVVGKDGDQKPESKALANMLLGCFFIYLIGGGLSTVYFNYSYARDHGFFQWMLFGEIVPTMKGAVWPYFAFKAFNDNASTSHGTAKAEPAVERSEASSIPAKQVQPADGIIISDDPPPQHGMVWPRSGTAKDIIVEAECYKLSEATKNLHNINSDLFRWGHLSRAERIEKLHTNLAAIHQLMPIGSQEELAAINPELPGHYDQEFHTCIKMAEDMKKHVENKTPVTGQDAYFKRYHELYSHWCGFFYGN